MALGLIPRRRAGDIAPPWREMEDFVNRFMEEMPLAERTLGWVPSVDISESDGKVMVKAELPGLDPKDIDVEVTGDLLVLRGEKSANKRKFQSKLHNSTTPLPRTPSHDPHVDRHLRNHLRICQSRIYCTGGRGCHLPVAGIVRASCPARELCGPRTFYPRLGAHGG